MTMQIKVSKQIAEEFEIPKTDYIITQNKYIQNWAILIKEAISSNITIPIGFQLELIQGINFIRINLCRTDVSCTKIKCILIISIQQLFHNNTMTGRDEIVQGIKIEMVNREKVRFYDFLMASQYVKDHIIRFITTYQHI